MTYEVLGGGVASAALPDHAASVGDYLGEISLGLLGNLSDADLLAEVRALEAASRQVQVAWHGLVGQLEQRGLAGSGGCVDCGAAIARTGFSIRDKSILSFGRVLSSPSPRVFYMTTEALSGGVASAALLDHAASVGDYLGEISLGLLGKLSDADLLAEVRTLEAAQRQVQVAWHGLVGQLEQRGLADRVGASSVSVVLQGMLRLSPHEAKQRVDAATVLGPRVGLDGQELPPLLPVVAAAQAEGSVSVEHARVIAAVLDRVPGTVAVEDFEQAEAQLVDAARSLRPLEVGKVGKRILAHLDPDGVLASDEEHHRRRDFTVAPQSDGSYRASGYLTPGCGAQLVAVLSAHAAPTPAEDGTRDPRTHGQRMHDALETLSGFAVRRGELERSSTGTQLVITMTADQLTTGHGLAETSFGQLISVQEALRLADEASLALILRDTRGAVLWEGRTKRCATRAQTLALIARDKGCSFPGCDRPPDWCQRHHIIAWIDEGPTDIDNLTLLCGHHHRNFHHQGWQCQIQDGLPWWTPPPWIDPNQQPQLNQRIHHA